MSWSNALVQPRAVAVVGWQLTRSELLGSLLDSELLLDEETNVLG